MERAMVHTQHLLNFQTTSLFYKGAEAYRVISIWPCSCLLLITSKQISLSIKPLETAQVCTFKFPANNNTNTANLRTSEVEGTIVLLNRGS